MRLLLAPDALAGRYPLGAELDLEALATAYAPSADARNWLRGNMVSTLDGAAQGADGRSGTINTPADHVVFELLRALSDLVLIGAGTARAEGYGALTLAEPYAGLRAASGRAAVMPLALVTASGALPASLLVRDEAAPVLAITPARSPGRSRLESALGPDHVIVAGEIDVDLALALQSLHDRGFHHILTEGGPTFLGTLLAADLLDELDLTVAPSIVGGSGRRIVSAEQMAQRFRPHLLVEQDGSLMGRWLRAPS